jgi:hypothetical protein
MVELPSIVEVADELASGNNLDAYSFAYIDRDQWRASPETTPVFLSTRDDDEDFDDAAGMPIVAARKGLRSLLAIADLEGVVTNFHKARPNGTTAEIIEAINHYRENDAYKYVY